jgi:hypothetical protein
MNVLKDSLDRLNSRGVKMMIIRPKRISLPTSIVVAKSREIISSMNADRVTRDAKSSAAEESPFLLVEETLKIPEDG